MAQSERRALLIAPTLPARTGNGLAIRLGLFVEALAEVCRTEVICIPVFGRPVDDGWLSGLGVPVSTIDPTDREDTHYRLLSRLADPADRLAAFRRYGRGSPAARLSAPVLAEVRRLTDGQRHDLVHAGRSYMMEAALAVASQAQTTVDLDEDDAWSWRSLARIAPTREAAGWARAEADAADGLVHRLLPQFGMSFISSGADGRPLARRHGVAAPIVVANPAPSPVGCPRDDDGRTIVLAGSFGYAPNLDGLEWFVSRIWPRLRQARADLRFRIIGRDLPARFDALDGNEGVEVIGAVPSLEPLYGAATLAIAPLRAGGGTRIKLIEAAAFGVPIVATSVAARGLSFGSARCMWRAETEEAFADAVAAAMADANERARRAGEARRLALRDHDRGQVIARLACRFAALLAK